jgi:2-keto-3-deoxy-L-fuconate dehydrogenase
MDAAITPRLFPACRRLEGKRAFVTAAAQGIGRAIALRLAAEGAHVTAVDVDAKKLSDLSHDRIETVCADVTDSTALARLLDNVNVVVNCVGWVHHGTILECPPADWRRTFQLNVDSIYEIIRLALPAMLAARTGSIVNIASLAGQRGAANRAAYSASKAAVVGLTKSISADFASSGIRCNAICPAMIDTPSLEQRIQTTPDPSATRALFVSRHPVGRLGSPEEVAALAAYLASDESAFMTGAVLVLDGGAGT